MPEEKPRRPRLSRNDYMKYTGMAFQMGAIILIGAYAGQRLDAYYHTSKPYFTVGLSLLAIFAALYLTLKDLFIRQ